MSHVVYCHEAQGLPVRVSLALEMGEALCVYLLDEVGDRVAGPRATILRRAGELAPAGSQLLFEAELGESGRFRVLRVTRHGGVPVDLLRSDGRSRLGSGVELRSGARLEVDSAEREAIALSLSFAAQGSQGAGATAGGGGTRASRAASAQATLLWVVPSALQIIRDPLDDIKDGAVEWLGKSGISPRTFTAVLVVGFSVMGSGAFGVSQYFAAEEARDELAAVQAEAAGADAGRETALAAEAVCIADRRALAAKANEAEAVSRISVEAAMQRTQAAAFAVSRGGARYEGDELAAFDKEAWEQDVRVVLEALPAAADLVEPGARCRAFTAALENDLPAYILASHPDPTQACPTSYVVFLAGTSLRGSWGLSDRVLLELAAPAGVERNPDLPAADPRDVDRGAASMLATGVRAVRERLLTVEAARRPVVAPSELNLWSLALFEAANRLPPPSPGAEARSLAQCAADVVAERIASVHSASPGEPVLPSVASVLTGAVVLTPNPTASCPWPDGAIGAGVGSAVRAVARQAAVPPEPKGGPP